MIEDNDLFVIIKLVNGEQLMAVLVSEDEDYVELKSPMSIKMIPIIEERKEHITAHPFCQFSDDNIFVVSKTNLLFIKKLHHIFVPHYKRIVADHEKTEIMVNHHEEDLETETIEDVHNKIKLLQSLLKDKNTTEEKPDTFRVFVEGNDTIN